VAEKIYWHWGKIKRTTCCSPTSWLYGGANCSTEQQSTDFRLTETKPATSTRSEKLPARGREMILARREELRQGRSERNSSGFISQQLHKERTVERLRGAAK